MSKTTKGQIGVTTENIFPVIKQFLYSDHEIFLRELVANAVDATQKLKALAASGDLKEELGELQVRLELDEKKKILKVIDSGIGMTEEEVDKFINQIAFSSAGEFLEKYKDQIGSIIGHFGLGFYSAFMVSKKVTIDTLSWKEGAQAVQWSCDGSPEYEMKPSDKKERGTVITLYLDDDSAEFAQKARIGALLDKYCKFMPVPTYRIFISLIEVWVCMARIVSAMGLARLSMCSLLQQDGSIGIESVQTSSSSTLFSIFSHALPLSTPCVTTARTDFAPPSRITSAALHNVPAVSAMSSNSTTSLPYTSPSTRISDTLLKSGRFL